MMTTAQIATAPVAANADATVPAPAPETKSSASKVLDFVASHPLAGMAIAAVLAVIVALPIGVLIGNFGIDHTPSSEQLDAYVVAEFGVGGDYGITHGQITGYDPATGVILLDNNWEIQTGRGDVSLLGNLVGSTDEIQVVLRRESGEAIVAYSAQRRAEVEAEQGITPSPTAE